MFVQVGDTLPDTYTTATQPQALGWFGQCLITSKTVKNLYRFRNPGILKWSPIQVLFWLGFPYKSPLVNANLLLLQHREKIF